MEETENERLLNIALKLSSMTFILNGYCQNFEQEISEFAELMEFTHMLHETSKQLYDLL